MLYAFPISLLVFVLHYCAVLKNLRDDNSQPGEEQADADADEDVGEGHQEAAGFDEFEGFVTEGGEGGQSAQKTGHQADAHVGRDVGVAQPQLHDQADDEGPQHVYRECSPREMPAQLFVGPARQEVTCHTPQRAEHGYVDDGLHARDVPLTAEKDNPK